VRVQFKNLDALSRVLEQPQTVSAQRIAALGIHAPGIPISGRIQNAPQASMKSLSS
jgi:hypothetical protein